MTDLIELSRPYKRAPSVANSKQWPRTVTCRFIEPGLVKYEDLGMILVQRPALNKMAKTFVGKPVIDEKHVDATPENFTEVADGVVIRVWTNPEDGWDWCEFLVWDDETYRHCKDPQYHVSCAYNPTQIERNGGRHNNVDYDGEFLDATYTHLAIVKDPRYEGAHIVHNSKGGSAMKNLLKLFTRETVENSVEVDGTTAFLEVDGEKVSIENAVSIIKAENAKAKSVGMKDDDVVEIDGKKYSGADLKAAVLNAKAKKNAQEKGEKAGDQEDAEEDEKKEGEKRDKGEAKNAVACEAHDKKDCEDCMGGREAKNSLEKKDEKGKHLEEFKETAEMRNNEPATPNISTQVERLKAGNERYGKMTKEVA